MEKLLSAYDISTSALVSVIVTPYTQKDTFTNNVLFITKPKSVLSECPDERPANTFIIENPLVP